MAASEPLGDNCFDELIRQLRAEGHADPAARLHALLKEVAWTTSSELWGELGLEILAFERSGAAASPDLRRRIDTCMRSVRRVWPDIK
jgi:hypothetical protein